MTVDDVVTKTGITLAVIIAFAVVNFGIAVYVNPTIAIILTVVGGIGGFITVLVATFAKKWGSAPVTLIYAALEGLFVGGFSLLLRSEERRVGRERSFRRGRGRAREESGCTGYVR